MNFRDRLALNNSIALSDGNRSIDYRSLHHAIDERLEWLREQSPRCVALALDNGIEWVLFDLACQICELPCVPVPLFFSASQRAHILQQAGCDLILHNRQGSAEILPGPFKGVFAERTTYPPASLPRGTSKITFTSGSSGTPKGVCLSLDQQLATAEALLSAVDIEQAVHLSVLPLATLLENVAGVYVPLLLGGTVYLPALESLGFAGSRLQSPQLFIKTLELYQPDTLILVPELLQLLLHAIHLGWQAPRSLRFIAVGGARVAGTLLEAALASGLPVYQGYGLSECGSVVALNTLRDNRIGSIGKVLSHVSTVIQQGELRVRGNTMLGYLDDPFSWAQDEVRTGDLVSQDEQGFLWFEGRRCNQLTSSFGRNINPEWPESELLSGSQLKQAVVLGDARPHCIAILVPARPLSDRQLADWLALINARLPDYAQVKQCLVLDRPMDSTLSLYTDNGRPNRRAIFQHFSAAISHLYNSPDIALQRYSMEETHGILSTPANAN